MRVRCPNCSHPIELVNELDFDQISCPSCGSNFWLSGSDEDTITAMFTGRVSALQCFKLLDAVGAGQFGRVWRAHDEELDRIVAIKVPHRQNMVAADRALVIREAQAVAQLNHPNIVRVYEVGRQDEFLYIVSEYIQGRPLSQWWREAQPSAREAAQLCLTVTRAVQHAHDHKIVHRDLKPGNIVMDDEGQPHITDFGLAKREGADVTIAVSGQVLGTPAYMAPEQVENAHVADHRADIYSLGVMLYELICHQRPFVGGKSTLLHQILHDEPKAPRAINRKIPRDLETICLKALAKNPDERYQTATRLADDLERFLKDEPIQGRRVPWVRRTWRWARRRPATVVAALLVAVVLVLAGALWWRPSHGGATPSATARNVEISTLPAKARIHLVPLHPITRMPQPELGFAAGQSPVTVSCEPGEYLVVAYQNDEVFHEVYRHVPAEHEKVGGQFDFNGFKLKGETVVWPQIRLFGTSEVTKNMARVTGGEFTMITSDLAGPTRVTVPDFFLDVTEVTVGDLQRSALRLPAQMATNSDPDDEEPVHGLKWGEAMQLAEQLGKRLQREEAFMYVATSGGLNVTSSGWQVVDDRVPGPVTDASFDRVTWDRLSKEVIGLRSNLLEFTVNPFVGPGRFGFYVRRGGFTRRDNMSAKANLPPPRYPHSEAASAPQTGFRCMRSVRPSVTAQDFIQLKVLEGE